MQYKKVEKVVINGKHMLLYDDMFLEDDPDYAKPEPVVQLSEEEWEAMISGDDSPSCGDTLLGVLGSSGIDEYFGKTPEQHDEELRKQKKEQNLPHKLRMDLDDSKIVRLKDEKNLTFREVAERLHCSPNTVRNRYNKAKEIK